MFTFASQKQTVRIINGLQEVFVLGEIQERSSKNMANRKKNPFFFCRFLGKNEVFL